MFFTEEDYRKIEKWLSARSVKDTDLKHADSVDGTEKIPIVQDGVNKVITLNDLVGQLVATGAFDFFNVSDFIKDSSLSLEQAIGHVPVEQRKPGLVITFKSQKGNWLMYQFKGASINQWGSVSCWNDPMAEALEELVMFPDNEDLAEIVNGNRSVLKLKDREYDPEAFSGKGMIILRKNIIGTELCSVDDKDHPINLLTQDMVDKANTIYIVRYDFDLDGRTIHIRNGCTLLFQGGTINNGNVIINRTKILGIYDFNEMGTAKFRGDWVPGQLMTFIDDSGTELKWFSGTQWKTICSR